MEAIDVAAKLAADARQTGRSFKEAVNYYLRLGLTARKPVKASKPFKVRARAQKISTAEANGSLALQLAQTQNFFGDWHAFFRDLERIQALTTQNLSDAMSRTLVKSNRTVGIIVSAAGQAASSAGGH